MKKIALQIAITILLVGCAPNDRPATETNDAPPVDAADTVYTNGKIYTVNEDQPWAEAVVELLVKNWNQLLPKFIFLHSNK